MSVLVEYTTEDKGLQTALLVGEGRKYLRVVTMDVLPMRVRTVPLKEGKYMRVMPYNIVKALKVYRRLAKRDHGPRSGWPAALKEALAG